MINLEPAIDLKRHAARTMQEPTKWVVGVCAYVELSKHTIINPTVADYTEWGLRIFGIKVVADVELPDFRVVLKAGENTVGAVTLECE